MGTNIMSKYNLYSQYEDDEEEQDSVSISGDEFGEDTDWDTEYDSDYGSDN